MKRSRKFVARLALLASLALVAAACGSDDGDEEGADTESTESSDTTASGEDGDADTTEGEAAETDTTESADDEAGFVIGTVLPESGGLAFLGPPQIQGVELARADLEAAGANVSILTSDSGTDGAVAQEAVNRLLGEGAHAIVGAAASGVSQDIIQGLFDASVPQCSASNTSPAFSDQDNAGFYFRTVPPDEAVSPIIADVVSNSGHEQVAIVARADDYGNALADLVAAELDGLGVANSIVSYDPENVAADSIVGDVTGAGADSVVFISFDEAFPIIAAALEAGIAPDAMYGADGVFSDTLNASVNPEDANVIDGFTVIGASGGADFNARLSEETGGNLIYGGQAYDCVITLALAFAQTGSVDGAELVAAAIEVSNNDDGDVTCTSYQECADAIANGDGINYDGVAGPLDLDENGDPTFGRYAVAEFQDGVLTTISSQDADLNF